MNDRSDSIDPQARPDYLDRFGLQRAPFAAAPDADFFCADSTLTQRLDMLQHLTGFGMLLLLVIGESGVGKSSVLRQFLQRAGAGWQVCHLEADTIGNAHDLARDLATGFDVGAEDLEQVRTQLDRLHAQGQLAVLVVDDAERLPEPLLQILLELSGPPGQDRKRLRLVLFGAPELAEKLAALSPEHAENAHTLSIPRLTELQTAAYLHHRLNVAGHSGESPFTPAQVKSIHKAAQGIPAAINARAHQMLSDQHTVAGGGRAATRAASAAVASAPRKLWLLGAAAVAVATIGALLWHKPAHRADSESLAVPGAANAPAAEKTVELALPQTPASAAPAAAAEPGKGATSAVSNAVVHATPLPQPTLGPQQLQQPGAMSPNGRIAVSALPAPEAPPAAAPKIALTQPVPPPTFSVITSSAPTATPTAPPASVPVLRAPVPPVNNVHQPVPASVAPVPKPVQNTQAQAPAKPTVKPVAKPAPAAGSSATAQNGNGWLRAQKPGDYTLQLLGARREAAVHQFIAAHALKGPLTILHSKRQGQDWYVLLYGAYPSRAAAAAGLARLPAAVRAGHPWPRRISAVRDDLASKP